MNLFINCDDNPITLNKKNYLLAAAKRLGIDAVRDLKSRTSDEENKFCLNVEPCTFYAGTRWSGMWEIDLLCDRPQTGDSWANVDMVFLAGCTYPSRLKNLEHKINILFQACDPTIHKRTKKPVYDFVQCGSMDSPRYEERGRLVSLLRDKGYTFMDGGKDKSVYQYIDIISQARVQFIRSMKSHIADGELAQRFFECLAIGPVLTNYVKDLELLGLVEGVDYFSYKNDDEMITKFDYLIKNPDFAEKMAINGRNKAILSHTYEHRLVTILTLMNETIRQKEH